MVLTKEVDLPLADTLNVKEINVSLATLMTAAPFLGKYCENINSEFMLCRQETNDPRPCIELGKKVTDCAMKVLRAIKKECLQEFNQNAHCIEKSSGDYSFCPCRNTQTALDECMFMKLCMRRPDFGYFCRARVHESRNKAPPAPPCPCHPAVPDPTPSLPDCKQRKPPRFSSRLYWITE